MLCVSKLDFFYGSHQRLKQVSFTLNQGERLGIFGHNGSGKSTLLKLLSAALPVKHGAVRFLGEDALGSDGYFKRELRTLVGVLFQGTSSDDKLSSWDNLIYFSQLMGVADASSKVQQILDNAQLTSRAHEAVKKLSGGMRRRLELYRTFLHQPMMLVLDEPTAGLDVKEAGRFFSYLTTYQQNTGAAVIMATHNPDELMSCDRVIMMKDGAVIQEGVPHLLVSQLDYVRCLMSLKPDTIYDGVQIPWFDVRYRDDEGVIFAKVAKRVLPDFLRHPFLHSPSIKGFTLENPSLADVYEGLHS